MTSHLIPLFAVIIRDHFADHLFQILVAGAVGGSLLGAGLAEGCGLGLIALADADGEDGMRRIGAVLDVLRVVHILQNTLAERKTVLVDVQIGIGVGVDVDDLKGDGRKIECHLSASCPKTS